MDTKPDPVATLAAASAAIDTARQWMSEHVEDARDAMALDAFSRAAQHIARVERYGTFCGVHAKIARGLRGVLINKEDKLAADRIARKGAKWESHAITVAAMLRVELDEEAAAHRMMLAARAALRAR